MIIIVANISIADNKPSVNNNFIWRDKSMSATTNIEIRERAKKNGVKLWMVAEAMGIADSGLSKKLRRELPADERERILSVIDQLAAGEAGVA